MPSCQVDSLNSESVPHASLDEEAWQESRQELTWTIQLVRRDSRPLLGLIASVMMAGGLVWLLFHSLLPALVAVLLLLGSVREYLFPITYRITSRGVEAVGLGSHLELPWKEVRRYILEKQAITLTSLPAPSRLDIFRGVTLRFALPGQHGERAQVLRLLHSYLPVLLSAMDKENA